MEKNRTLILLMATASLTMAQTPTELTFVNSQYSQDLLVRQGLAAQPLGHMALAAHQLFLAAGLHVGSGPITLAAANAYTDSLQKAGVNSIDVNFDLDMFVNNSAGSAFLTNYDSAFQHVIADGMTIKLSATVNSGAGGGGGTTTSQFTNDACNATMGGVSTCITNGSDLLGVCLVANPCFDTFAHFQAYFLGNPGPFLAMLTRYGGTTAGQGMNTSLVAVSVAHEFKVLTCGALNPNWSPTVECTPANWLAFGNAAVTLIRGIAGGTCTNCPAAATNPLDISMTAILSTDQAYYTASFCGSNCVFAPSSTLSSCGADVYAVPTVSLNTFLNAQVPPFTAGCRVAGNAGVAPGRFYVEENIPPNWTINSNPQSESNAYRAGANNDWNRYGTDYETIKTEILYWAVAGAWRYTLFNSYKLFWYAKQPSCPAGNVLPASCGAPNLACGTNGLRCFGDNSVSNPFISNVAAQLASPGAGVSPLGTYWKIWTNSGFTSGEY